MKDGLKARVIEKMSSKGSDGVLEATGYEVTLIPECWDKNYRTNIITDTEKFLYT